MQQNVTNLAECNEATYRVEWSRQINKDTTQSINYIES